MTSIKFIPNGVLASERFYLLELAGKRIGSASARVTQNRTGLTKVRGTSYTARVAGLDRDFHGSRATIVREITRALTANT